MNKKGRILTAFFVVLCFWAGSLQAARIITVDDDGPADFNTIQAAIDDSNDGDTVIVQPGLYLEVVMFHGKNVTVTSTNPGDFDVLTSTIIEYGSGFSGTEEPRCTLKGFKINGWINGRDTHATISHCFLSASANPSGTAISRFDGTIINCLIVNNKPSGDVFLAAIRECHGLIKNCTIAQNGEGVWVGEGTTTIENCIIYHNDWNQVGVAQQGTVNILYSDVQWGMDGIYFGNVNWGPGNIDVDPCFVREGYWDFNEPWTYFEGDYHLQSEAGRWDTNSESWVQDDVTSPCIDAGNPHNPIDLEPFPNGGRINMGAYGGTVEASKSYFGKPPCETIVAGDLNGDCVVNFLDFCLMAFHWSEDNSE